MANWTQPVCTSCWVQENSVVGPGKDALIRVPIRTKVENFQEALEQCSKCGRATTSGIFIRVDPTTIPYPRESQD